MANEKLDAIDGLTRLALSCYGDMVARELADRTEPVDDITAVIIAESSRGVDEYGFALRTKHERVEAIDFAHGDRS